MEEFTEMQMVGISPLQQLVLLTILFVMQFVKHFEVLEFNCLYTDIHMPLTCQLSCKMSLNSENSKDISYHANLTERIRSWDPTKSTEFYQNINYTLIKN